MIDNTVNAIVDTPEWRAAAGLPQQSLPPSHDLQRGRRYLSWVRAASKHLRILKFVQGMAEANENEAGRVDPPQLPFHPLHCAASLGMASAGKILLQRFSGNGSDQDTLGDVVNIPDAALGFTPLHWASVTNRLDFMLLLLEEGACIDSRDHEGRTPLYACAAFGAANAADLLLHRGAAVDGPDFRGLTPLHAAAAGNHIEVVEELLSAGACVQRRSSFGYSARHVAERQGHASIVGLLATAARDQSEGRLAANRQAETIAEVGGGDPLCWLFPTLRATIRRQTSDMRSAA